jgi:hypothetical protein
MMQHISTFDAEKSALLSQFETFRQGSTDSIYSFRLKRSDGWIDELFELCSLSPKIAPILRQAIKSGRIDGGISVLSLSKADTICGCAYAYANSVEDSAKSIMDKYLRKAWWSATPLEYFVLDVVPGQTAENNELLHILDDAIALWQRHQ